MYNHYIATREPAQFLEQSCKFVWTRDTLNAFGGDVEQSLTWRASVFCCCLIINNFFYLNQVVLSAKPHQLIHNVNLQV